ncbi:YciI family protein [Temperatibacter marinus]|uniref:YciI family protein n=1 Tax=Temperatibacter marinus TaxID=1456591 RepID=A0AA52EHI4_9PROT|nr:YciI family protein [Temperatibacter marinus]WND03748.1 YciI family protein [Temperatibacter marinus]
MLFIITCTDNPNSVDLRMATRPNHIQYLKDAGDRLKLAGPKLTPGEDPKPIGSVIIIDADSEAAAKLFAEHDPYNQAGLFEQVTIEPYAAALGAWVPQD